MSRKVVNLTEMLLEAMEDNLLTHYYYIAYSQ